jgi:hypothetical protein
MIDKNRIYRTRDGREVRIYATDGGGDFPVHGAVNTERKWSVEQWMESGRCFSNAEESNRDLIEVRPRHKRTVWLNVYGSGIVPEVCSSKERADCNAGCNRIACIKVDLDFAEGDGL